MDELQKLFIAVWQKNKSGKVVHPWVTREIRDSIKTKDEAYKLARKKQPTRGLVEIQSPAEEGKGLN